MIKEIDKYLGASPTTPPHTKSTNHHSLTNNMVKGFTKAALDVGGKVTAEHDRRYQAFAARREMMAHRLRCQRDVAALNIAADTGKKADGHLDISAMFDGLEVQEAAPLLPQQKPKPRQSKKKGK